MCAASDQLADWADFVFAKEGWHVSLWDAVKDLSAAQAAWTPAPPRNSIWLIVNHVALWKDEGARRIAREPSRPAGWHVGIDWKPIAAPTDDAWRDALRTLRESHARVIAAIRQAADPDLVNVRGLIAHDSYHSGQVCYLRAMQGIPVRVW